MRFLVQPCHIALGADGHQGSGAGIGLRHRQSEIQRAGTERGETDAGFAGEMSLGGRHESGALLMAGQHETNTSITLQSLHKRDILLAGNAVDDVHAFVDEAFDEQVGDVAHMLLDGFSSGFSSGCSMVSVLVVSVFMRPHTNDCFVPSSITYRTFMLTMRVFVRCVVRRPLRGYCTSIARRRKGSPASTAAISYG